MTQPDSWKQPPVLTVRLSCSKLDLFIDTKPAATRLKVEKPFSLCPFVALLSAASLGFVYGRSYVTE